jgi:multimeric flavodoxin WrbA
MTKVTILTGSPRKNGSTRILAGETERGLNEQEITTETVFLNDLKIGAAKPATGVRRTT